MAKKVELHKEEKITALYCRLSVEDMKEEGKKNGDESNSIQNQESICQGGILRFNTALKKWRGVNPSWLQNSIVQGICQGCHKARQSRFAPHSATRRKSSRSPSESARLPQAVPPPTCGW